MLILVPTAGVARSTYYGDGRSNRFTYRSLGRYTLQTLPGYNIYLGPTRVHTPRTDHDLYDLYDLFLLHDVDLSGQIDS